MAAPTVTPDDAAAPRAARQEHALRELLALEGNSCCADCRAPDPKWASVSLGAFLCLQCSGPHRALGTSTSFVLSLGLDEWTDAQLEQLRAWGNARVNALYEFHVPPSRPHPSAGEPREYREAYIRDKYEARAFTAAAAPRGAGGEPLRSPARAREEEGEGEAGAAPPPLASSASGMVEYVGLLHIRPLHASPREGGGARLEAAVGAQRLKGGAWDEPLRLCWDGRDALELSVLPPRGGALCSCRLRLDGLPARTPTALLVEMAEGAPRGEPAEWAHCAAERRSVRTTLRKSLTSLLAAKTAGERARLARSDGAGGAPPPRGGGRGWRRLCCCVAPPRRREKTRLKLELCFEPIDH
ncbi:hypothetical protein AB1Y20_011618 [Prymnesium parvum]|uniref:Arf-GAP domain-containing protein n=1 Tax=Prymnesium parvum TaxID=97485 RepID=A0AB34IHK2_PRYPA